MNEALEILESNIEWARNRIHEKKSDIAKMQSEIDKLKKSQDEYHLEIEQSYRRLYVLEQSIEILKSNQPNTHVPVQSQSN